MCSLYALFSCFPCIICNQHFRNRNKMKQTSPVRSEGDIGEMVCAHGSSIFPFIEQQRKTIWLFYRGKKSVQGGREGRNNQSVKSQAPAQLQLNWDSFYDSALGYLDILCLVETVLLLFLTRNKSHTHNHSHYQESSAYADLKCNITLKLLAKFKFWNVVWGSVVD